MENKIKGKIEIKDFRKNKKAYELYEKYSKQLITYIEQFDKFKSDYEHLKEKEPLKSKIETLKKVFRFDEKNYNVENPGPTDEEIDCVKDLCECCKMNYYEALKIDNGQKPIFFSQQNEPTQTESWKNLLNGIKLELWWNGCFSHTEKCKVVFDDKAIKKIIIDLPSFERLFQERNNIKEPDVVAYVDYNAWHCSIIELIEADDFIDLLTDKEEKKELEFLLKNEFIGFGNYRASGRCPIEIERALLSLLQDNTLGKFDMANKLLNFYYKTLPNCFLNFKPYLSFAYKVVDLFDKKLLTANGRSDSEKFKKLCKCATECAQKFVLGNKYYNMVYDKYMYEHEKTILSVKKIFSYVDMFETQHTKEFNLTNKALEDIKNDIENIFCFMKEQALIIDDSTNCSNDVDQIPSLESLNLSAISANSCNCFCEFCIMFFTHFIALWDGILFDGPLKIKKSAQLRKFVNFLRQTQINQIPSNLTLKDFKVNIDSYTYKSEIKFNRYDQTSIFQSFKHLRATLPEIPQQEHNQDNLLL